MFPETSSLRFHRFVVGPKASELRRDGQPVMLRAKSLAVLRYLAERPGELVTKEQLLDGVWGGVAVSDGVLKVCMSEIRSALGDELANPRFVATVHRRGYRFVANVVPESVENRALIVGRAGELAILEAAYAAAHAGRRRIVFVCGEAGIGKTALVERFLAELAAGEPRWTGRGQCLETIGASEGFHPIFEAFTRLCRGDGGTELVALLGRHAPSWLREIPGAAPADGSSRAATRGRMLRELVVGLEAVSATRPLVLVLEDLHWSDPSTLDFVRALARRQESMRLLVVGTYRSIEPSVGGSSLPALVGELVARRQAIEMRLGPLDEGGVAEYLAARFVRAERPAALAPIVRSSTGGHPLLLVTLVDPISELDAGDTGTARLAAECRSSSTLARVLDDQLERLDAADRRVLEGASVAGQEFAAALVAAAIDQPIEDVAARLRALSSSGRAIRPTTDLEWPDGTVAPRFEFAHALWAERIIARLDASRLEGMHRRVAKRLLRAYGSRVEEVAGRLAMHFERANDVEQAIAHRLAAGRRASRRFAYGEAIVHLETGLEHLRANPEMPGRFARELELLVALGTSLVNVHGFAAAAVERTYGRALDLAGKVGDDADLFPILDGLHGYAVMRDDISTGLALAEQMHRIAERSADPTLLVESNHVLGCSRLRLGNLAEAERRLSAAIRGCDDPASGDASRFSGHDPKTCCLAHRALALWLAGRPAGALAEALTAVEHAERIAHPVSLVLAEVQLAWIHQLRGEEGECREVGARARGRAREHGFAYWVAAAELILGEGSDGAAGNFTRASPATGRMQWFLARVAGARRRGERALGLAAVGDALELATRHGERYLEAEFRRHEGELRLSGGGEADDSARGAALAAFLAAERLAREQGARMFELGALRARARRWRWGKAWRSAAAPLARILEELPEAAASDQGTRARGVLAELGGT